jgi:hypothetical protein
MMGMRLAGFGGMVMGVMAMARGGVRMVRRAVGIVFFIMLCGLAMMLGGLFVMLGGFVVVLAGGVLVRGHGVSPFSGRAIMARHMLTLGGIRNEAMSPEAVAQISSGHSSGLRNCSNRNAQRPSSNRRTESL